MKKIETEQYIKLYKKSQYRRTAHPDKSGTGTIIVDVVFDTEQNGWYDVDNDFLLPQPISDIISGMTNETSIEMTISFTSSTSMYGGDDNLGWESESDDERIVTDVEISTEREMVGNLPENILGLVGNTYSKEIEAADVDYTEPEDDYDPREDYDDEYDPRKIF